MSVQSPKRKIILILVMISLIGGIGYLAFYMIDRSQSVAVKEMESISPETKPENYDEPELVINVNPDENQAEVTEELNDRKEVYGVEDSVDIIVKSDESVKIGDKTISVQTIMDDIAIEEGKILEEDLEISSDLESTKGTFGIYLVRPGDNIWNVHYRILTDFFNSRGIHITRMSDEPNQSGFSSGIGKILKFSENKVYIYNIETRQIERNLNLIHPKTKIIVYNMDKVFDLLEQIDYTDLNRLRFDGDTLWFSAEP